MEIGVVFPTMSRSGEMPGAAVPPIIVGGLSDRAFGRATAHGDRMFLLGAPE